MPNAPFPSPPKLFDPVLMVVGIVVGATVYMTVAGVLNLIRFGGAP